MYFTLQRLSTKIDVKFVVWIDLQNNPFYNPVTSISRHKGIQPAYAPRDDILLTGNSSSKIPYTWNWSQCVCSECITSCDVKCKNYPFLLPLSFHFRLWSRAKQCLVNLSIASCSCWEPIDGQLAVNLFIFLRDYTGCP